MITYKPRSLIARQVAASGEYEGKNDQHARAVDEVVDALEALTESVCNWKCPSQWKSDDGQPHSEECKAHRALVAKARGAP